MAILADAPYNGISTVAYLMDSSRPVGDSLRRGAGDCRVCLIEMHHDPPRFAGEDRLHSEGMHHDSVHSLSVPSTVWEIHLAATAKKSRMLLYAEFLTNDGKYSP